MTESARVERRIVIKGVGVNYLGLQKVIHSDPF